MTADLLRTTVLLLQNTADPDAARALLAQAAMAGADPQALRETWDEWRELHDASVTVLYTSAGMEAS